MIDFNMIHLGNMTNLDFNDYLLEQLKDREFTSYGFRSDVLEAVRKLLPETERKHLYYSADKRGQDVWLTWKGTSFLCITVRKGVIDSSYYFGKPCNRYGFKRFETYFTDTLAKCFDQAEQAAAKTDERQRQKEEHLKEICKFACEQFGYKDCWDLKMLFKYFTEHSYSLTENWDFLK